MKTLSDKEELYYEEAGDEGEGYYAHKGWCNKRKDIKEFIKQLKEELTEWKAINKAKTLSFNIITKNAVEKIIDKLAGDKLIMKDKGGEDGKNNN